MQNAAALAATHPPPSPPAADIGQLKTPEDYRTAGRAHLFPSDVSLRWFMRRYRRQLLEGSAILVVAGRLVIDAAKFDAVVFAVGRERAGQAA